MNNKNSPSVNRFRLGRFFERAEEGSCLTIAFLGGSITQGSLATKAKNTYAARVFHWYEETFPDSVFSYINRGVGGTDSFFGTARAAGDVLSAWPDMVFVDFSVNDPADDHHRETYEGLLRCILKGPSCPAVAALGNARYDDGTTAEDIHRPLCEYYGIPYVSVKDRILPLIQSGAYRRQDLSPDGLHPNDTGHRLIADAVTEVLQAYRGIREKVVSALPAPMTADAFEGAQILRARGGGRSSLLSEAGEREWVAVCHGFLPDPLPRTAFRDFFREGWEGSSVGDTIRFDLPPCTNIGIQYRRTIHRPAPKAMVQLDDREVLELDGNFDEDWGDCLALEPVLFHGERMRHTLTLTLSEAPEDCVSSFYLLGILFA